MSAGFDLSCGKLSCQWKWRWKSSSPASSLFSPVFHRWDKIWKLCHSDPMWDRPKRWTSFSSVPTIFVPTSASSQVLGCLSRSFNDGDYPYYGGLRSRIIRRIFLKSGVNEGVFASPAMVTPNLDKVGFFLQMYNSTSLSGNTKLWKYNSTICQAYYGCSSQKRIDKSVKENLFPSAGRAQHCV